MRRTRLIWFAAGAATSAVATISVSAFSQPEPRALLLRIEEPEFNPSFEELAAMTEEELKLSGIAMHSGNILHSCGVGSFSTTLPNSTDGVSPYAEFDILNSSPAVLDCVWDETRKIQTRVSFHKTAQS